MGDRVFWVQHLNKTVETNGPPSGREDGVELAPHKQCQTLVILDPPFGGVEGYVWVFDARVSAWTTTAVKVPSSPLLASNWSIRIPIEIDYPDRAYFELLDMGSPVSVWFGVTINEV